MIFNSLIWWVIVTLRGRVVLENRIRVRIGVDIIVRIGICLGLWVGYNKLPGA